MSDKSLKDKAIKIKGKDYVLVSDRVRYFNEHYPQGWIYTKLVTDPSSEMVIVKATVHTGKDYDADLPDRAFTGYSQAVIGDGMVNKTAALENAETSAVGRALGFMGIGVIESIASADEMHKSTTNTMKYATDKQINWMRTEAQKVSGFDDAEDLDNWIRGVLSMPPQQVLIFKVKDAVDKIKAQKEEVPELEAVTLSKEDEKKLKDGTLLDDIPY